MDKEFIIWGIPSGSDTEQLLYTKATSHASAKKVLALLEKEHSVRNGRIQILDLSRDPSADWNSNLLTN